jgi:WD40 repeat protein/serine/threonine protein kinase
MSEEDIFHEALNRDPADRAAYLDRACAGRPELRFAVEGLLRANVGASGFLGGPAPGLVATIDLPAVTERPGTEIGPYKLMEQIGEGGFGLVFVAEQTRPVRRKVALKIIKPGMDTRQVVARFEAERQALALMDHPNIAKVLDGGETINGRPYFVMELVKGVAVTDYCDQHRLTPRERLGLFLDVGTAVQHAHQKGVIHRDLKPSNVLVVSHDGTPVVKVIDFGIAKAVGQQLTDKTIYTQFAQLVGTPLYMSPEQAGQSGLDVDTRSDIYSLGVLLYELLTGATPFTRERFQQAAYEEIRRIIREEEPPRPSTRISTLGPAAATVSARRQTEPRQLQAVIAGELDWIVMKCLEKDRNRRYETAASLAADVRRFLGDEPVQACPPSAWYRFKKFSRRNRREVLAAGVAAVAGVAGVVGLGVSRSLIAAAKDDLADALARERREAYFHRISLAHRDLSADNLGGALKLLEECPEDLREWEWHYLMRLCVVEPLVLRDTTEVNGVAFRPDGKWLASAGGDGAVKIWNLKTGNVIHKFPAHTDAVLSVAFHREGQHLASLGADRKVKVWDLSATDQPVFKGPSDAIRKFGTAYSVAFSPDGRTLAAGSEGWVRLWDWENKQILHSLPGREFQQIPVAFSRDGRLATLIFRQGLMIWDPEPERLLLTIDAHRHPVSALAFSPDDQWLASASFDRTVKLSDSRTGAFRGKFDLHTGTVDCVAFSLNGKRLASGGEDKTVRFWDATTRLELLGLRGHTDRCGCVAFSPDGWRLASASSDRTIRIWDATPLQGNEGQEILTFNEHTDEIRSVAFSPDGQRIASAGHEGLVKVWDAQTGRVIVDFSGHEKFNGIRGVVFCLAWHPKGHTIASTSFDTVRVWDARTGEDEFRLPYAPGKIGVGYLALAFRPDGGYLVTGKEGGAVQVWDAATRQEVGTLDTHKGPIRGVVFSQDGRHLATASSDGIVKLWDAKRLDKEQDGRLLTDCARVPGPSVNVAFSPDGRRLATGGEDNTVKIWDVESGKELQTLKGHTGEVYTVAFSPVDGRWVASGGGDSTVKVWDSHTGKLVRGFRGHKGIVSSVSFSPDGSRLVSGSRDNTVKVWDVSSLGESAKH